VSWLKCLLTVSGLLSSNFKNMTYIESNEQRVFSGQIIAVVQKDVQVGERLKQFERAMRAPGVRLIIDTSKGVLLNDEYRHELGENDMRLPGGKVFDRLEEYLSALERGDNMQDAAQKAANIEASEEMGMKRIEAQFIDRLICGATMTWDLYYFAVHDYDHDEDHVVGSVDHEIKGSVEVSYQEAWEMCMDGRIKEGRSVAVLLRWLQHKI
jgi:ADP-ribose pyrophosphatase